MQFVSDKVAYALSQGLKVIACVGETLEQRESGSTVAVVAAQTKAIAGTSLPLTKQDSHVHYLVPYVLRFSRFYFLFLFLGCAKAFLLY